ncbi:MAG: extracellular solute-binding protein [Actinomycetales bacterium]|nr:extracellular solute-binding protein [Actinomycetales bacterium]
MQTIRSMRQRGRVMTMTAIAAVGVLGLAACSSSGSDTGSSSSAAGGDQTITVWHYFSADNQVALMDKYASMFEDAHPGVTVDNVYVPYDQMNSKLVSSAGAKTGPDVVVFNGAETATIALGGALAPLDDQLSSFQDAGQLPDSVIHKVDGTTYAVQGYVNLLGLWYNADILDKIGVQPPTTIDELEAAMAKAKDAGYRGITLSALPNSQGEWQAYPWLTSEGFSYDSPDATAMAAGLSRVRSWVEKGCSPRRR